MKLTRIKAAFSLILNSLKNNKNKTKPNKAFILFDLSPVRMIEIKKTNDTRKIICFLSI